MATTYLTRSISSGADLTKWTWSCWVKRTDLIGAGNNYQRLISNEHSGDNSKAWYLRFQNSTEFHGWDQLGSFEFTTNAKFRDVNGWYHLVVKYDSTQSTESNRLKVYANGEEQSFSAVHYPTLNEASNFMNSNVGYVDIGFYRQGTSEYFGGLMSHMHFTAGYAYDASAFGSTDATTGEWKINTSPNVTYGSLGFFILKDGNSVTDQSPNTNNFTVGGGTLTKTEDNPSNIFCTLNSLATGNSKPTFSNGSNRVVATANSYQFSCGTIAVPLTGKWYWEVKADNNVNGSNSEYLIGAVLESRLEASGNFAEFAADGITQYGSVGTGIGANDIIGVSVDRTAATLKIYKNNSLILTKSSLPAELLYPMVTVYGSGVNAYANFGNGYFGTTAVSSAGTNASNNGIFEYDVIPSDANALSTKGINS